MSRVMCLSSMTDERSRDKLMWMFWQNRHSPEVLFGEVLKKVLVRLPVSGLHPHLPDRCELRNDPHWCCGVFGKGHQTCYECSGFGLFSSNKGVAALLMWLLASSTLPCRQWRPRCTMGAACPEAGGGRQSMLARGVGSGQVWCSVCMALM